jgi:hypothetical protein
VEFCTVKIKKNERGHKNFYADFIDFEDVVLWLQGADELYTECRNSCFSLDDLFEKEKNFHF